MAYSLETVIAEKLHAMIALSLVNSRMKDFFDVYCILVTDRVDSGVLAEATRLHSQIEKLAIARIIRCSQRISLQQKIAKHFGTAFNEK